MTTIKKFVEKNMLIITLVLMTVLLSLLPLFLSMKKANVSSTATTIAANRYTVTRFGKPVTIDGSLISPPVKTISYNQIKTMIDQNKIASLTEDGQQSTIKAIAKNGTILDIKASATQVKSLLLFVKSHHVPVSVLNQGGASSVIFSVMLFLLLGSLATLIVVTSNRKLQRVQNFNQFDGGAYHGSRPHELESISKKAHSIIPSVRFKDIAGNESVRNDINFMVDFLKSPSRYREMGARMPKGIIFYGPPGTGKTLYAKAIAGEAGVPFFSVSGSDFVEMYVGVGAKRVRELFAEARKKTPSIVFIDEIDAVGKKRGLDNNTEKDQTINALLTELDGFSTEEGIIVIGATNRIDMLDDALIRPGRFDKHIAIPLPEYKDRLKILEIHGKNKRFDESVNFEDLAKLTIGFSGAGLESLLNESAILATSRGKNQIDFEDIDDAYYKVVMKGDKKSTKDTHADQLKLVAWHEAGHALVAKLLTKKSIPKITIVPSTSGAGGVTFIIPEKAGLHTKMDLLNDIKISYGGRIAEYLLMGDYDLTTTGASQDIKHATNLIVGMIKEFGMTEEFGMLYLEDHFSKGSIIQEAKAISKKLYAETEELLTTYREKLADLAALLIERETIGEEELDGLFKQSVMG